MTFTKLFEKYGHIIGKDEITGKWVVDEQVGFSSFWRSFPSYNDAIEWARNHD